jgi:predicted RNA-binding protein YlqC (UPF0109 family)
LRGLTCWSPKDDNAHSPLRIEERGMFKGEKKYKVKITLLDGEQSSIIELTVAPEDMGKVIGKQGRNAQAIRVILGAAGMKLKRRVNLEILEKG